MIESTTPRILEMAEAAERSLAAIRAARLSQISAAETPPVCSDSSVLAAGLGDPPWSDPSEPDPVAGWSEWSANAQASGVDWPFWRSIYGASIGSESWCDDVFFNRLQTAASALKARAAKLEVLAG